MSTLGISYDAIIAVTSVLILLTGFVLLCKDEPHD
jgi:hypothetical protein